jgi:FkbM family methyltransferase
MATRDKIGRSARVDLRRAAKLWSPGHWRACRRIFRNPWRAAWNAAFLGRGTRPLALARGGPALAFSRRGRDQVFWDWALAQPDLEISYTPDGEIALQHGRWNLLLRPGTSDFYVFREIFLEDEYGLLADPAPLRTVVDLGANAGLFACAALPRAQRVVAVEAATANHLLARRNVARNGGNADDVLRFAAGAESGGTVALYLSADKPGDNSVVGPGGEAGDPESCEHVPTISLFDLFERQNIDAVDLLKCDVEGAEFDVLQAAPIALLRRVARVTAELHFDARQGPEFGDRLALHLQSAGHEIERFTIDKNDRRELQLLRTRRRSRSLAA